MCRVQAESRKFVHTFPMFNTKITYRTTPVYIVNITFNMFNVNSESNKIVFVSFITCII